MPYYWGHGWWMLVWWFIVAVGIVWFVWVTTRISGRRDTRESAEEELRRRFAAGEVSEDDYRKRMAVLREDRR
jgi:putative membrane protein